MMGGALAVSSAVGVGSKFHFELDLPWTDEGDSISETLVVTDRLDGMRILVVDDNELNRLLARKLLERVGATIEEELDGGDAVARLGIEQFDAVLMDWQMPTMDGLAATRAIRAREKELQWRRTPVIGVSARALAGDRAACLEAGMDEYIVKPFQREHLIDVLVDVVHGTDRDRRGGATAKTSGPRPCWTRSASKTSASSRSTSRGCSRTPSCCLVRRWRATS